MLNILQVKAVKGKLLRVKLFLPVVYDYSNSMTLKHLKINLLFY